MNVNIYMYIFSKYILYVYIHKMNCCPALIINVIIIVVEAWSLHFTEETFSFSQIVLKIQSEWERLLCSGSRDEKFPLYTGS